MKTKIIPLLIAVLMPLAGCAYLQTPEGKSKVAATSSWLAGKVAEIAISGVVNAAVSQFDANNKASWLDSLAQGVRTSAMAGVTANDVKAVAAIWAPAKPHWQELAVKVAEVAQDRNLTTPKKVEAIAVGLNEAAEAARLKAASGFWPATEKVIFPDGAPFPLVITR